MRAHTLALLAAVTLSGCAHEARKDTEPLSLYEMRAGNPVCTNTYCPITVTVKAGCIVSVSPNVLGIDDKVDDAVIHWAISADSVGGAAFTNKGIDPKDPPGPWNSEFRNGTPVGNPALEFTWVDKNKQPPGAPPRKPRPYGYNVFVIQDGAPCPKHDPTIINGY